jgi:hypothetical protein
VCFSGPPEALVSTFSRLYVFPYTTLGVSTRELNRTDLFDYFDKKPRPSHHVQPSVYNAQHIPQQQHSPTIAIDVNYFIV